MKKKYIIPALEELYLEAETQLLDNTSIIIDPEEPADPNYNGGGDVKVDLMNNNLWNNEW